MALIFISHATKNKPHTETILKSLKEESLESIFLSYHDEHGIEIGEQWAKVIYKELEEAHVVLLLLTPEWVDSFWCKYEYEQARVMGKKILPLIVEHGSESNVLENVSRDLQHYDMTTDTQALSKLIYKIKKETINIKDTSLWDIRRSPFPGFRAFEYEDRQVFWGKEDETREIVKKLSTMQYYSSPKLLVMLGASGMGKSSLLKAGVIPALEREDTKWTILPILRPRKNPLESFVTMLSTYLEIKDEEQESLLHSLQSSSYQKTIDNYAKRMSKERKHVLITLDQAEELYSVSDSEQKEQFIKVLTYLLLEVEGFYSIWTLRSDYLSNYQLDTQLQSLHKKSQSYTLEAFEKAKLSEVIKNPAKLAGIEVDEDLIEQIKEDIVDTDALPLLALCLRELYSKHAHEGKFTLLHYLALTPNNTNPLEEIVQQKAEEVIAPYKENEASMKALKRAFIPLLVKVDSKDKQVTSQVALWKDMPKEAHEILEALVERRLLIKNNFNEVETIEISHEALLRVWSLLAEWIEEEKEFLIGKSQLEVSYAQWSDPNLSKSEKKKALLSGLQLDKALGWRGKLLDKVEIEYIDESENFRYKQKRVISIIYIFFIIILLMFIYTKNEQMKEAISNEKILKEERNKSREEAVKAKHNIGLVLVEKALSSFKENEVVKAHYYAYKGLQLIDSNLDYANMSAIAKSVFFKKINNIAIFKGHTKGVMSVAYSPDGNTIVSASHDNSIRLWDVKSQSNHSPLDKNNQTRI